MTETRSAGLGATASSQGTQAREPEAPGSDGWSRPGRRAPHRETTVVGLCLAVLVTHVLDENFVQPEPGTAAGDHLASGLIPVLLLVATMVVYVRLRAGLRATMAMTLGALGLVIGKTDLSGIARVLLDPSHAVMTAATTIFSNHMPPAPIVDRIGGIAPRPILLIHAVPGMGGESTRQPEYFAAAGEPRTIWNVPGSSHTGGLDAQPVEYERRVTAFFEAALLDPNRRLERSRP